MLPFISFSPLYYPSEPWVTEHNGPRQQLRPKRGCYYSYCRQVSMLASSVSFTGRTAVLTVSASVSAVFCWLEQSSSGSILALRLPLLQYLKPAVYCLTKQASYSWSHSSFILMLFSFQGFPLFLFSWTIIILLFLVVLLMVGVCLF